VRAGGQRLRVAGTDPEAAEAFGDIERAGREALTELRAMLHVLRDPSLPEDDDHEPLPDAAAIPALVDQVRRTGRDVQLTAYDVPADLPARVALAAHREVQECLTNALRHGTGPVSLAVESDGGTVRITVANAIEAPGPGSHGAGRGLAGMRERVRILGGTLFAGPRDGCWYVDATLPVSVPA
jgi:signal transduction histidine kinase